MLLDLVAFRRKPPHLVIPAKAGIQLLASFSSFRRKPLNLVIPAKAGIQLLALLSSSAFRDNRPASLRVSLAIPGERVTSLCLPKEK